MAQSYLFLLAFVVAIALASNIPPSAYVESYRAANNTSLSHHLIIGNRLPGDSLVLRQNVVRSSSWLQVTTVEHTFSATKYNTITLVKALDQKTNGNGAYVTFLRGGPGFGNVTLRFKSQRGHGINFVVEIYSRA